VSINTRKVPATGTCSDPALGMVVLVVLLLIVGGCSNSYQMDTATVRGSVTLDGKPLRSGSVMFVPERGRGAVAKIHSDGTFQLGTYDAADGAIVGRHKVAVYPPRGEIEQDAPADAPAIPQRYQSSESSGIVVEVKPTQENVFDIKLVTTE